MNRRVVLLLGAGVAALACGVLGFGAWMTAPTSRVNKARFDQMQVGMSKATVRQILGEAGEDMEVDLKDIFGETFNHTWKNDTAGFIIYAQFDADGLLAWTFYREYRVSLYDRIRRQLHRQLRL